MFQLNDTVLYGAEGVYRISEIKEMDFKEPAADYYVLESLCSNASTIFVPVHNEALKAKMRRVLSVEEIYSMIRSMPKEIPVWIEDESTRSREYKEILIKGNHRELVHLIKTLYVRQQEQKKIGKNLHKVDERFLKDAEKLLYKEFAYVLDIEPDQVLPFIQQQIEAEEKGRLAASESR